MSEEQARETTDQVEVDPCEEDNYLGLASALWMVEWRNAVFLYDVKPVRLPSQG